MPSLTVSLLLRCDKIPSLPFQLMFMKYVFSLILLSALTFLVVGCSERKPQTAKQKKRTAAELEQISAFLETREEQFEQLESGIWVSVSHPGDSVRPSLSSIITTAYRTESLTGILVDSATEDKPLRIRLARLIKGWQIGLPLIGQGGKLLMIVPARLAYKERSIHPRLEGWTPLYFEIDLLKVEAHRP